MNYNLHFPISNYNQIIQKSSLIIGTQINRFIFSWLTVISKTVISKLAASAINFSNSHKDACAVRALVCVNLEAAWQRPSDSDGHPSPCGISPPPGSGPRSAKRHAARTDDPGPTHHRLFIKPETGTLRATSMGCRRRRLPSRRSLRRGWAQWAGERGRGC